MITFFDMTTAPVSPLRWSLASVDEVPPHAG
jgi:hypothetical protein